MKTKTKHQEICDIAAVMWMVSRMEIIEQKLLKIYTANIEILLFDSCYRLISRDKAGESLGMLD
jgi:hypothetical protein